MNPEERPLIDKYLAGKAGIPTEHRLRLIRMIKDMTTGEDAAIIHAEGSLAAQKMAMYAAADWERYKAAAKRAARIDDGKEHPIFSQLPKYLS